MKRIINLLGSVLLTILVLTGVALTSCEQAGGTFGASSGRKAAKEPNGLNDWTPIPNYAFSGGGGGHCVYGADVFLSANWDDGTLGISTDNGASWMKVDSSATTFGAGNWIKHLGYFGTTFWAVGKGGHVAYSPSGTTWTAAPNNPLTGDAYSIAYDGNGTYMIVTDITASTAYPQIALYKPGSGWTLVANPIPKVKIDSVVYFDNRFIVFCNDGWISYTTNPTYTAWVAPFRVTTTSQGTNVNHFKMAAVGTVSTGGGTTNVVVAVSRYGITYTTQGSYSPSDWTWVDLYPAASYSASIWLNCVAFDGSKFIAAGQNGAMAYSNPTSLDSWTVDENFQWTDGLFDGAFINGIAYKPSPSPSTTYYLATGGDSVPRAARTQP